MEEGPEVRGFAEGMDHSGGGSRGMGGNGVALEEDDRDAPLREEVGAGGATMPPQMITASARVGSTAGVMAGLELGSPRSHLHQVFAEDDRPVIVPGDLIDDQLTGD